MRLQMCRKLAVANSMLGGRAERGTPGERCSGGSRIGRSDGRRRSAWGSQCCWCHALRGGRRGTRAQRGDTAAMRAACARSRGLTHEGAPHPAAPACAQCPGALWDARIHLPCNALRGRGGRPVPGPRARARATLVPARGGMTCRLGAGRCPNSRAGGPAAGGPKCREKGPGAQVIGSKHNRK
jgi:hypothetical protein